MADECQVRHVTKSTGTMKWLDPTGFGYIINGDDEVFVRPSALSSKTIIKEGDMVSYNVIDTKGRYEAVDIEIFGVECCTCDKSGHMSYNCPTKVKFYWIRCSKCGLIGHCTVDCDQKFYRFLYNKTGNKSRYIERSCDCKNNCWLSLFGGPCGNFKPKSTKLCYGSYKLIWGPLGLFWPHVSTNLLIHTKQGYEINEKISQRSHLESKNRYGDRDDDDDEELRYVVCVKNGEEVKKIEEDEDCFILDFDPSELPNLTNLSMGDNSRVVDDDDDDDVCILAHKGKVACRDYPHSRHLCATNSFANTPHESHCPMCYCYVCDVPSPCKNWTSVSKERRLNHCDASDDIQFWRTERRIAKNRVEASQRPPP